MFVLLLTAFVLAILLGFEIITKVPPTLHTPLMSGANAISGITVVGAVIVAGANAAGDSFIAGFLGGALWGLIPALLKARWQVNEVITSLMMVYIASNLVNHLVYGPWKGPEEMGFPYTSKFSDAAQLPRLAWTRIHYPTLILAFLLAVVIYILIKQTKLGYEIRVTGENPAAARYAGMSYLKTVVLVMILSGGLAGLAGVGEVAGIHFRLRCLVACGPPLFSFPFFCC